MNNSKGVEHLFSTQNSVSEEVKGEGRQVNEEAGYED